MKPSPTFNGPGGAAIRSWDFLLSLGLLWCAGVALRATILALPPVLPAVSSELGLTAADIGVLAGLPSLLFAVASLPAAKLIARLGPMPTLIVGLLVNAVGAGARGFAPSTVWLEAATAVMCLGVAMMQPVLPALVRAWTPGHIGLATAVYTNGLLVGEVLPIVWIFEAALPLVGGGWRAALVIWALPVLATAAGFILCGKLSAAPSTPSRTRLDWRDGRIWRAALLLGGVIASYFGLNGFLPAWLFATGRPGLVQPALIALNLAQIPASLLMLLLADRLVRRPAAYGVGSAVYVVGVVGVILIPGPGAVVAVAVAGFANAGMLTLALTVPSLMSEGDEVPRLSAAMFSIGYGFAVTMAILAGRFWEWSGLVALALWPFALTAALSGVLGWAIMKPRP